MNINTNVHPDVVKEKSVQNKQCAFKNAQLIMIVYIPSAVATGIVHNI